MKAYHAIFEDKVVGEVTVEKEGLYYTFQCCVSLKQGGMYRLILETEKGETDLGILMPCEAGYAVRRKLSVKQVCGSSFHFRITERNSVLAESCIPVSEDQPFPFVDKLQNARLQHFENEIKIVIADT